MHSWRGLLDLKNDRCGHLIFYSSKAQLLSIPAINFFLEMSGEDRLQFTQLDKFQLLSPVAHLPSTSFPASIPMPIKTNKRQQKPKLNRWKIQKQLGMHVFIVVALLPFCMQLPQSLSLIFYEQNGYLCVVVYHTLHTLMSSLVSSLLYTVINYSYSCLFLSHTFPRLPAISL